MSNYVPAKEVAKMLRKAFKEAYPTVKFSVRSDHNSINVRYTDGPVTKEVERITGAFVGSYFDGMIDYKGNVYHELDGERVSFGSDHIFVNRNYSDEAIERAIKAVKSKYATNLEAHHPDLEVTVEGYKRGSYYNTFVFGMFNLSDSLNAKIGEELSRRTRVVAAKRPSILARVKRAGDDGYGMGTTGIDGSKTAMGYPG